MIKLLTCLAMTLAAAVVAGCGAGAPMSNTPADASMAADQAGTPAMTGGCHCGYVRYEVSGSIIKCSTCDCRGCQLATGTLKAPFVTVAADDFKLTGGKVADFRASGGKDCDAHGVWHFCPHCGTPIFWSPDKPGTTDIFAGTLDDSSVFQVES